MLLKLFKKLMSLLKKFGRRKEDISWKEINGIVRENKSKK